MYVSKIIVRIVGIIKRTPKLRDSQAGRGGCFPSLRVDRSHVNIAHLAVCNSKTQKTGRVIHHITEFFFSFCLS